jgi:probable HAF family extracellular repeat protein
MRVFRTFLHFLILPLLACPLLALADPVYTMRLLPSNFTATGLNNAGQVVGNVNYAQVAIWSDAGLTLMPELGRSVDSVAISNRGDICGSVLGLNGAIAFSYSSGAFLDINSKMGGDWYTSRAFAISDNGTVVGSVGHMIGDDGRAFIYRNGKVQILGTLGGFWSEGRAVSDSGYVAGYSHVFLPGAGPFEHHAYLYKDGTMQDLGTFAGGYSSMAKGVTNDGRVVGWAELGDPDGGRWWHPFLYANGKMIDLGLLGSDEFGVGSANAINKAGVIVGESTLTRDGWDNRHAFIYQHGKMIDLNTLVADADGWVLQAANAINDTHQILARACRQQTCTDVLLSRRPGQADKLN